MIRRKFNDDANSCTVTHDGFALRVERDAVYGDWFVLYTVGLDVTVDDESTPSIFTNALQIYDLAYLESTAIGWRESHITDDDSTGEWVDEDVFSKLVDKFRHAAVDAQGL